LHFWPLPWRWRDASRTCSPRPRPTREILCIKTEFLAAQKPSVKKEVVVSQQMWQDTSKADWALLRSVQVTSAYFCIFLPAMVLFSEYFNVIPWGFRGMPFNLSGALVVGRSCTVRGGLLWVAAQRIGPVCCVMRAPHLLETQTWPKVMQSGAKCRHGAKMSKVMFWFLMKQIQTVCKLF
jgi:hypothetical protein